MHSIGCPASPFAYALPAVVVTALALAGSSPAPAAVSATWSAPVQADAPGRTPAAIACPTQTLCVAVDRTGYVLSSTEPAAASATWSAAQVDGGRALVSISCPSTSLCVAVDQSGGVLSSTNLTAPGGWSRTQVDQTATHEPRPFAGVSCPSASLCVAVDQAGNVFASTDPGASMWTLTASQIAGGAHLQAVACATATLCVATDGAGDVHASANPTGSSGAWQTRAIDPALTLGAVSCTDGGCLTVDSAGNALMSVDPSSAAPTWSSTNIDAISPLTGASCLGNGACAAVDGAGAVFASDDPGSSQPAWMAWRPDPGVALAGISCTAAGFCAAVDDHGRVFTGVLSVPAPPSESPPVAVVSPHPTVSGVPAIGSRLLCDPGIPAGESATLTYSWWRDGSPIPGADAPGYRVVKADATHHLQCWVTATNAAGSATAHSAFVAVPAEGVLAAVGETVVGLARARGSRVVVPLTCSPRAAQVCVILMRLTATGGVSSRARGLRSALAGARVRLAPGQSRTVSLQLTSAARKLLAHRHRLTAELTVTGTVIGVITATLARQRLLLGAGSHVSVARPAALSQPAGGLASAASGRAAAAGAAGRATSAASALTPTPYMGWDTYFALGPRYSESTVLEQASALISNGMERLGYRYVWLDVGWWQGQRDVHGRIVVNRSQWPHGLEWLTATLHVAGLLAGLYTDAGSQGCGGLHQGSYGHYRQDADTFAAWGFDAVKVDFCGGVRLHLQPQAAYAAFGGALRANSSRRPMLLSICDFLEPGQFQGEPPFAQSAFASYTFGPSVGNSWRTDTDVGSPGHVTFATVLRNLDADAAHPEAAGPGHWNDPDYLGPDQGLTDGQFRAQLTMWAVLAAPLMVSDDLRSISSTSLLELRNPQALAIDQDPAGAQATLLATEGEGQVWSKPLTHGARAIALLNRGPLPLTIQTSAAQVGMAPRASYLVRDVWAHAKYTTAGAIAVRVPGESAALLRVDPAS